MSRRILFRADGSHEIGFGHIVRSLALAQMLKDDFLISFYCKQIPAELKKNISELHFGFFEISSESEFLHAIQPNDYIVLDGYNFTSDYQKNIKTKAGKLISIDDLHDQTFYSDLIINHAPNVKPGMYDAQPYSKFALGPDYALLRPSFLVSKHVEKEYTSDLTLFICFGGSDFKNLTPLALQIAINSSIFAKIIVVLGSGFKGADQLKSITKKADNVVIYHALDEKQMAQQMLEANVALVPASSILFEALATGNKVISGMYVDNQKSIYTGFKNLDAIIDVFDFSTKKIEKGFKKIRSFENPKVIDGKSSERFQKLFYDLSK